MRFKLLQGKHESGHPMHRDKTTGEIEREDTRKFFNANDPDKNVIENCSIDLVKMFGREKFQLLDDEPTKDKKK